MKKWKHFRFMAIIAITALIGVTIACDNDTTTDDPKPQTATITGLFDNNASAIVSGTFTNAEWNGVPDTIKTALNTLFPTMGSAAQNMCRTVYARGVTIIVEKNPTYTNWKADGDKTIWINFNIINDEQLGQMIMQANSALNTNTASEG
jgi:hypothetical protein